MKSSIISIDNGSKKPPPLTNEQAEQIIRKAVLGADVIELAKSMEAMALSDEGRAAAAALVESSFEETARFQPDVELGKARARLDALFLASWRIQDFKGCLAVQKEINALLNLAKK